jgi:cytochrome c5
MSSKHFIFGVFVLASVSALALAAQQDSKPAVKPVKDSTTRSQGVQSPNDGARIFDNNCSRCHSAPEGFSTRISGTIVRHMRVRASLSQQDEEKLLQYFNP